MSTEQHPPDTTLDFDSWIEQNGLGEVKGTFIEYGMCSLDAVSMQNPGFPRVMDSITSKCPSLVSEVVKSMQRLAHNTKHVKLSPFTLSLSLSISDGLDSHKLVSIRMTQKDQGDGEGV